MEGKALGLVGMTAEEEVSDYRAAVDGAGRSSSRHGRGSGGRPLTSGQVGLLICPHNVITFRL